MSQDDPEAIVPVSAAVTQTSASPPVPPDDHTEIAVTSADFDACVLAAVPADVKPALQGVFRQKAGHSLLAWFFSLAVVAAAACLLYWMMPVPKEQRVEAAVNTTGLRQTDRLSRETYFQASEHFKAKKYAACADCCRERVTKLLEKGGREQIQSNGLLLNYFFNSVLLGRDPTNREAVELSRKLYEIDPDTPQWCFFYFQLDFPPDVKWLDASKDRERLTRARKRVEEWRPAATQMREFDREQSDFLEAMLNLELWCAHGPFCGWEMDEDCLECLKAHERVWEIVSANNYDTNRDFLNLRIEFLNIMKGKCSWGEHYTIGRKRSWRWSDCDAKLKEAEDRLKTLNRAEEKR